MIQGTRRGTMLLHWERVDLDDDRHANSVWGAPLGDPLDEESLAVSSPGEVEALEQLFAQRQRRRRAREADADGDGDADAGDGGDDAGAGGSGGGGGWTRLRRLVGTKRIALIEAKRAQNVTIALATFEKGLPASAKGDYDALCAVILSRLPRHAMLASSGSSPGGGRARERQPRCLGDDPERLEALRAILPAPTEREACAKAPHADAQLGPCERFFRACARAPPRLGAKLDARLLALRFDLRLAALRADADRAASACRALAASRGLALVLRRALAVGNLLNEGSRHERARAVSLASLPRIVDTRGVDKRTSVLDYVVQMLAPRGATTCSTSRRPTASPT